MTLANEIQIQAQSLPQKMQNEVLDFINFLQWRSLAEKPVKKQSLSEHPAFGSWRGREINALKYQETLRTEWDDVQLPYTV